MHVTLLPIAATWLSLAAATAAQAQILDSFQRGPVSNTVYFNPGTPPQAVLESLVSAPVPGGTRRLQLTPDFQLSGGSSVGLETGGGLSAFASGGAQRLSFNFAYGTQTPMNLDLSGSTALRLDFYASTPVSLVVYASTQTSPGANADASTLSLELPALYRQSYDIPLSAFVTNSGTGQPVNWAQVDGLSFFVNALGPLRDGGDAFWIDRLSAVSAPVPEPASAALLALGLAALAQRRRRISA